MDEKKKQAVIQSIMTGFQIPDDSGIPQPPELYDPEEFESDDEEPE